MNNIRTMRASLVSVAVIHTSLWAYAEPSAKPAVCQRFVVAHEQARDDHYLVCLDSKRPTVWTGDWTLVLLRGRRVAVGFKSR